LGTCGGWGRAAFAAPHTYYIFRNRNRASERRKAQNVLGVEISYEKSNDDDEAAQANAARLALVDSLHAHIGDVRRTPNIDIYRNRNRASERRKAQNVLGVIVSYKNSNDEDEANEANAARLALVDSLHAHIGDVCPTPSAGHVICVQHAKQNALP